MSGILEDKVARFGENEQRVDKFVNGARNATWTASTGVVLPSIQKFFADTAALYGDAEHSALLAQMAADAAMASSTIYPTEEAGRAATQVGQLFRVVGAGSVAAYLYRKVAAATPSVLVTEFPSLRALDLALAAAQDDILISALSVALASGVKMSLQEVSLAIASVLSGVSAGVENDKAALVSLSALTAQAEQSEASLRELALLAALNAQSTPLGSTAHVNVDGSVRLPEPTTIIVVDVDVSGQALPPDKTITIPGRVRITVDGVSVDGYCEIEVQGSSSQWFPKKNWTLALFADSEHTESLPLSIGGLLPHDEWVFKSNWIDNLHSRNVANNILWEQMVQVRAGWPKREVEKLYYGAGDGPNATPTGAIGHVMGWPAVINFDGEFYGIGSFNIGKKRQNYNLDKDSPLHIQLEPQGQFLIYEQDFSKLEVRRPETWNPTSEAAYQRFKAFCESSKSQKALTIDEHFDRATLMDYLILCQVIDLWDHFHKNTLYTTWDGLLWYTLPYDMDSTMGLSATPEFPFFGPDNEELHPADKPVIPITGAWSNWHWAKDACEIYGTDIEARYKNLRDLGIVSVDNIMRINCGQIDKFGRSLFKAESLRWPTAPQECSVTQLRDWLSVRIAACDEFFNYQ